MTDPPVSREEELTRFAIDEQFMRNAMAIAHDGTRQNEVPIGALIVQGMTIISGANNRTVRDQDPTAHAEMLALREAALRLASRVREGDVLARLGGEEFALLLYGTDLDQAGPILETMRRRIGDIVLAADGSVTISIGATTCNDGEDLEGLYARADALLYASKREGRDKLTLG